MSVEIREPRADEAALIAELLNEHANAAFGEKVPADPPLSFQATS